MTARIVVRRGVPMVKPKVCDVFVKFSKRVGKVSEQRDGCTMMMSNLTTVRTGGHGIGTEHSGRNSIERLKGETAGIS